MSRENHNAVHCPRCGYDQRGVTSQWAESCDLFTTCSECGLEIDWAEVFCPEKFHPMWCVEYARRGVRWFRSIPVTFFRSFAPWRFFHWLRISHEIRWGRLIGYVCVLLIMIALMWVVEQSLVATRVWFQVKGEFDDGITQVNDAIASLDATADFWDEINESDRQRIQIQLNAYQAWLAANPRLDHSYWMALAEAIVTPGSKVSVGSYDLPHGIQAYPAPTDLHRRFIPYYNPPYRMRIPAQIWHSNGRWLLAGLAAFLGIPAAFVLLPVSRRIQNVRGAHLVRLWLYSFFIPVAVAGIAMLSVTVMYAWTPSRDACGWAIIWCTAWPMLVALVLWWTASIRTYLQMPHSWAIAPLFAVLSILLAGSILFFVAPHWIVVV